MWIQTSPWELLNLDNGVRIERDSIDDTSIIYHGTKRTTTIVPFELLRRKLIDVHSEQSFAKGLLNAFRNDSRSLYGYKHRRVHPEVVAKWLGNKSYWEYMTIYRHFKNNSLLPVTPNDIEPGDLVLLEQPVLWGIYQSHSEK